MSNCTYNNLWKEAEEVLADLLTQELSPEPPKPERDRSVFFQRVATLYVQYLQIFRQLEEAYDQIVQPQKRRLVKELLDGVMGRVVELKNEMVEAEFSEYHYMDDIIQDLKLTPDNLEIPIPRYFISERRKELQERDEMLSSILEMMQSAKKTEEIPKSSETHTLSMEHAVKIIQALERGRQGRKRARLLKKQRKKEEEEEEGEEGEEEVEETEAETEAASAILVWASVQLQKVGKGFIQRRRAKKQREEEMIFLGMAPDPNLPQPCPAAILVETSKSQRRVKQEEFEEDYQKSITTITANLRVQEGPDMKEAMKDQICQWIIECHDATGTFPEYPDEENGGSAIIFVDKTPEQMMEELAAKEEEEANKKAKGKDDNKDKGKTEKEKAKKEEEEPGLIMQPSAFLSEMEKGHKTFTDVWQNRDESRNFSQRHEPELIKEEKRKEIEAEIRLQVDELMRQELANWKLALSKEKGGKGKAKAAGKKKGGAKGGQKKKKEIDLTADRTLESLYQELVEQGLIKPADNVKLQDYVGDYSYLGTTLRQADTEPTPSLSDVRQVIALAAILPLGSQQVHEKAPLVKAILLVGPPGVGKKMLVHAICQETGAVFFDLSPNNVVGKYPEKIGLQMMLHLVFKVARLMQPSVIWIGDAEKMFYKKVPKEEKDLDPKRLKKDLPKILKGIKGEDRLLIVGTTDNPNAADLTAMCKVYTKIILIPRPDYASRYVLWEELIKRNGGNVTNALDISSLAKISDGFTQGHILQVVRSVLTPRRLHQLARRHLIASEFVCSLAKIEPVFQEEDEALKTWYAKTPIGAKRAEALEQDKEADTAGKDPKKKGKK